MDALISAAVDVPAVAVTVGVAGAEADTMPAMAAAAEIHRVIIAVVAVTVGTAIVDEMRAPAGIRSHCLPSLPQAQIHRVIVAVVAVSVGNAILRGDTMRALAGDTRIHRVIIAIVTVRFGVATVRHSE